MKMSESGRKLKREEKGELTAIFNLAPSFLAYYS